MNGKRGGNDMSKIEVSINYASLSFGIKDPRSRGSAGSPTAYSSAQYSENNRIH